MGTYTTNYNLFMPSIGEQGWGELVNGNFTTIDTTMEGLDTRVGTLETETDAMKEKLDAFEVNNGVIEGKFSGTINGVTIKTGLHTVTPKTDGAFLRTYYYQILLPMIQDVTYTGSITFKNFSTNSKENLIYSTDVTYNTLHTLNQSATITITFENVRYFTVMGNTDTNYIRYQDFIIA